MSSPRITQRVATKCLHPRTIVNGAGDVMTIGCGECEACLLERANRWSMRVKQECEDTTYSVFFTLTYDNAHVPVLGWKDGYLFPVNRDEPDIEPMFSPDMPDVQFISGRHTTLPDYGVPVISTYLSKRDIQLFKKRVAKRVTAIYKKRFINEYGKEKANKFFKVCQRSNLRSYIIGEYGPTKGRAHYHGLFFTEDKEIADRLCDSIIYESWQMCDKDLFYSQDNRPSLVSGADAANYVSSYLTGFNSLPPFLQSKSFRPFRLSSKSPAIGFSKVDFDKVLPLLDRGTIVSGKRVGDDLSETDIVLPHPACARLFPKCLGYRDRTPSERYSVYSLIWDKMRHVSVESLMSVHKRLYNDDISHSLSDCKYEYFQQLLQRLRVELHPMDYYAARQCYSFCLRYDSNPSSYLRYLDKYYTLREQRNLKTFYESMEEFICQHGIMSCWSYYDNLPWLLYSGKLGLQFRCCLDSQFEPFGFCCDDFSYDRSKCDMLSECRSSWYRTYLGEVHDCAAARVKSKKLNEIQGLI